MRVIKFRCWDKIEEKMWAPIIDRDGIPCAQHPVSQQLVRMDGILLDPIMQYTGLKDKNGKEIFESDVFSDEDLDKFYVVWSDEHCGWGFSNGDPFTDFYIDKMEVIGNIYEHKHLLEEK